MKKAGTILNDGKRKHSGARCEEKTKDELNVGCAKSLEGVDQAKKKNTHTHRGFKLHITVT